MGQPGAGTGRPGAVSQLSAARRAAPNQGERRITLSFNAIPGGLESWGYGIKFSA
jgi:hypothetical protein